MPLNTMSIGRLEVEPMFRVVCMSLAALAFVGCPANTPTPDPTGNLTEASMNFDSDGVAPFLTRLGSLAEGLSEPDLRELTSQIIALPIGSERSWEFVVRHDESEVPLRVHAVMDDNEAPDLYFYTSPQLATAIQAELLEFAESRGM